MSLLKDAIIETIKRMPENTTAKDIIYEIIFIDRTIERLRISGEEMVTTEELIKMVGRWSK